MTSDASIAPVLALQPLLGDWPTAALRRLEHESLVVRVIVARVRGSAPREPGACMLVDSRGVEGTVGGGNLEHEAIAIACELMGEALTANAIRICRMTLGRDLAQCCGGVVELWVERLSRADRPWLAAAAAATAATAANEATGVTEAAEAARVGSVVLVTSSTRGIPTRTFLPNDASPPHDRVSLAIDDQGVPTLRERVDEPAVPLWLYGAGHVGRALVRALAELPFEVTWIDSRQELLGADVPSNTRAVHSDDPVALARQAPATAYHLVMTHDHGLDFDLCHAILTRGEFAWHGLIGSASKAAKFRSRLVRAGVPAERVARLVSPIGIGGLTSKLPAAIAASVTVQLLQQLEHVAERAVFHTNTTAEPRKATLHDAYSGVRDWTTSHDACSADDCRACRNRQVTSR